MFKSLNPSQKFQPGAQLWLVFFEPKRALFKHINWRTGFLLQNFMEQQNILKPALIDTHNIFPNRSLLCLPLSQKSWTASSYHFWKKMDKPSFRVFTPLNGTGSQLNNYWPQEDKQFSLSYYADLNI